MALLACALLAGGCTDNDIRIPPAATPTGTAPPATATPGATASATPEPSASATPTAVPFALRLPPLHAEADAVAGGRIADAEGREVLLRGVNVNAFVDYWQGSAFPTVFPFVPEDADLMAEIGWNAVRLLLSWSRVEPRPGEYDDGYLAEVGRAVDALAARGIYTILDLHQDAWGPTLAARPDEMCPGGSEPALGWDGAPGWATFDDGAPRCAPMGIRELSPAVGNAFGAFFADREGPGGIGIRTRYVRMVGHVAGRLAGRPGVVGIDVMNEPNAFNPNHVQALGTLYAEALREIRAAEAASGAPPLLVLFEPPAIWSTLGSGPPGAFAHDGNVVYAPHIYTGGFTNGPITRRAFEIARDEAALFGGVPVLSGEWGSDPRRAEDPADGYFLDHQRLQDEFRFGATLWTWRESCGDPHKLAEARRGQIPYPWGEFEVDCATNEIRGPRAPLVRQLTRGWIRAAPGRIVEVGYDPASGTLSASGREAAPGTELVAFYPASKHGVPALETSGLQGVGLHDAAGGNLFVTGRAAGGAWSLVARPRLP